MPYYLDRDDLYRMLQRELPEDCYVDGAPSAFFSTADMASVARVLETGYTNLERIYENYFPQSADEKIGDWEVTVFGQVTDQPLDLQERRDRVVAKLRERRGITMLDVAEAITGALPILAPSGYDIIEWGCDSGGWVLDESELDVSTILNGYNQVDATGPGLCEADPSDYGKTPEEWAAMQRQAYTYEVEIFNRVLTAEQRALLDGVLTKAEPARSTHVITDDVNRFVDVKQMLFPGSASAGGGNGLTMSGSFQPQPNQRWAISWWAERAASSPTSGAVIFNNNDNGPGSIGLAVSLSSAELEVYWGKDGSNWLEKDFDLVLIDQTQKHHYLLFWDGVASMWLFVDGVSMGVVSGGAGVVDSVAYDFPSTIGTGVFFADYHGKINDAMFGVGFHRDLLAADALLLYNDGEPIDVEETLLRSFFQTWYWMGDADDSDELIRDRLGSNDAAVAGDLEIIDYP